ncbi:hypothetical protein AX14_008953 [Amanita brunnescens Koide BX004]|nr:hypothetical protein AX14_008953 [Amanita brunnescens Koide BX004]
MKFAHYLKDNQTPEWQKAYIDYQGLKKLIAEIQKAQATSEPSRDSFVSFAPTRPPATARVGFASGTTVSERTVDLQDVIDISAHTAVHIRDPPVDADRAEISGDVAADDSSRSIKRTSHFRQSMFSLGPGASRRRTRGLSLASIWSEAPWKANPLAGLPLFELYKHLGPLEMQFFTMLDAELDKVDSFYTQKESEFQARTKLLIEQFGELNDHRRMVVRAQSSTTSVWRLALHRFMPTGGGSLDAVSVAERFTPGRPKKKDPNFSSARPEIRGRRPVMHSPDLGDYLYAKKGLKKAVIEHYRAIEALQNYRILNVTGFRKALKKFQKHTKIPAQQQYMSEKIDRSSLESDKTVRVMMKQMEERYGQSFLRGNFKKARDTLRSGALVATHYVPTFMSGILLGFALPALVAGLHQSFQPHVREQIRGWDALLYIYGIFLIPVVFSILITVNLLIWAHFRINHVFIFELDTKSHIDYRQYLEIPSLLFTGLSYSFFCTFFRVGSPGISPSYWLFVWLGFASLLIFNPLPIFFRSSRFWFLKIFGRVMSSGMHTVEFSDFWLADQLCSFTFTMSNVPVFVCAYSVGFSNEWDKCGSTSRLWPLQCVAASLPLLARLIQSLRRYFESGQHSHLINAGKYFSGIISNIFYYLWRSSGNGNLLAIWCMSNTAYAIYASAWDTLVDWSLMQSQSTNRFLRDELVYPYHTFYYFAIISNFALRFTWAMYIPQNGLDSKIRSFIVACLEMLRRWQWDLLRLENEHIGNIDQYRITREVPLPYQDRYKTDDGDDEGEDDEGLAGRTG